MVAASVALQAWLIFVQEFNWDEFYFLGFVHDYLRGDLSTALQTIHIHLFAPLAKVAGTEIDQLIAGRLAMLAFEAVTFLALYKLCRIWTDRGPALFALCAYALVPATLQHGASFRTDPLALALAMTALACTARAWPTWKSAALIAMLCALAAMVTVKVIFFAPAFAGIAVWRLAEKTNRQTIFSWLAQITILAPIFFVMLYAIHQSSLADGSIAGSSAMMEGAARKTLLNTTLFPRIDVLLDNLLRAPVQSFLLIAAIATMIMAAIRRSERSKSIAVLGCAAPLLCLVIYRNAFPYFIPFIIAPAFTAVAWLVRSRSWSEGFQLILSLVMLATAVPSVQRVASRDQSTQRAVVRAVHEVFPQPVAMIDHSHMISGFPKRGFFMSTWGLANYRTGEPVFANILEKDTVPLLLLDSPRLAEGVSARSPVAEKIGLLDQDREVLRQSFIPHWGPIWVAGQRISVSTTEREFMVRIPGQYTLEGMPASIDGRRVMPGETIQLDRGNRRIAATSSGVVTLRWGNRLRRPSTPPPNRPLFQGF
jgi:hypothetical protein